MTAVALSPIPFLQVTEGGLPVAGALIFTYAAGTSNKLTTYQDSAGSIPNTNPIVCDANGVCVIWLQQGLNYDLVVSPANDTDPPTNQYYRYNNVSVSNLSLLTANPYAVAGGTSDSITASYSVASAALVDGYTLWLKITTPNLTVNPTFAPTLNGALQVTHNIVKIVNNAEVSLAAADLQGTVTLVYNLATTNWRVLNPAFPQTPILQNSQSAAYTTVMADADKHILHPAADNNARTFTIDSNANVAYPIGTTLTFVNLINTLTIAITTDTLLYAGTLLSGTRTLGAQCMATALKIAATTWIISGPGLS